MKPPSHAHLDARLDARLGERIAELGRLAQRRPARGAATIVHQARRALNVVTEALSLMIARAPRDRDRLRAIRHRVKQARRRLSQLRDQEVVRDQCRRQRIAAGAAPPPPLAAMRAAVAAGCAAALAALRRLPPPPAAAGRGIRRRLIQRYRRARKRAQRISRGSPAAHVHAWRKAVRRLLIDLDLVGPLPGPTGFRRRLRQLGKLLGRERDLLLTQRAVAAHQAGGRRSSPGITEERLALRAQALRIARRLFAHGGKHFARRLGLP
jgi:hypothetical protein